MTLAVLALVVSGPAGAQTPPPATPPTTSNFLQDLLNQLLPTTTTPAPATTTTQPPVAGATGAASAKPGTPTGSTTTTTTPPGVVPPEYIPIINSVQRTGSRTTTPLLDALRPLQDLLGMSAQDAALAGFGHFPVAGPANWSDDFLEPRFGPPFHLHQGNDIFAPRGTPVRAPFDGVVRFGTDDLGGNGAYLTLPDGTYYYMAHLDSFSKKFSSGASVKQGDVLGYTGDTGNAAGGATHVHFEIHPRGGAAIDPKPILDGWLADAINGAAGLLVANNAGAPRAVTGVGMLRRFDDQSSGAASASAMAPLLWASSVSAGGGTIRLAELQIARVASRIDWDRQTTMAQAEADALRQGRAVAVGVLGPLTPPVLLPLLRGDAS